MKKVLTILDKKVLVKDFRKNIPFNLFVIFVFISFKNERFIR